MREWLDGLAGKVAGMSPEPHILNELWPGIITAKTLVSYGPLIGTNFVQFRTEEDAVAYATLDRDTVRALIDAARAGVELRKGWFRIAAFGTGRECRFCGVTSSLESETHLRECPIAAYDTATAATTEAK